MKPRVLLVCFNRLLPAEQGNARRIMQLVSIYERQGFEIDLVYHREEGYDIGLSQALAARFARVTVLESRAPKRIEHPGHICLINDWYDQQLDAVCRQLHQARRYQVVHANYIWYTPLFEQFGPEVVKVLDSHDIFANRSDKYLQAGMKPQWFSTTLDDEDRAFRRADAVLAIQKEEASEMAARGHRNILYLPYVEPRQREFVSPAAARPLTLGYLGSGNDWNIRSLGEFIAGMRQRGPGFAHLLLVAGGVTRHIRDTPGVVKLGFVKELAGFYDAIDVAINPMVGGTGLKIKTVEPLCFGKPVLTTPAGAQGLGHLWQLPVFADAAAMLDYLQQATPSADAPALTELSVQAAASRQALDAEIDSQTARFTGWLGSRLLG